MDALDALAELQRAGFTLAASGAGLSYFDRAIGPFAVQVRHDATDDTLGMMIGQAWGKKTRYRVWSLPTPTPEAVLSEALNFIRVFESSACVGGD